MKKNYKFSGFIILMATGFLMFSSSCQKEQFDYLLDLDVHNISIMNESQKAIFDEAVTRMDKNVSFNGSEYVIKEVSASHLGLSQRLFDYLNDRIINTNTLLQRMSEKEFVLIEVEHNRVMLIDENTEFSLTREGGGGVSETPGGINSFDVYWFGCTFSLSHNTMKYMLAGNGIVGPIIGLFPYAPAQAIYKASVYLETTLAVAYVKYPNGIIISVGTDGCSIEGQ